MGGLLRRSLRLSLFALPLLLLLALVAIAPVTGPTAGSPRMWLRERYAVVAASISAWREGARVERGLTYATPNGRALALDLFVPAGAGPHPVVLFFHGGGWYEGNRQQASLLLQPYLRAGFAVANASYTLSGTELAPAAVRDARCALRWVGAHARQYRLDTARVVTAGISSGAHLALMAALDAPAGASGADALDCGGSAVAVAPRVAAVVNVYGPTDLPALLHWPAAAGFTGAFLGGHDTTLAAHLSPARLAAAGAPLVVTLHGTDDSLVPFDQAVRLHAALRAAGAPERLIAVPRAGHGFGREQGRALYDSVFAVLRAAGVAPPSAPPAPRG